MNKHSGMRPHDIVVLLKIAAHTNKKWQGKELAQELYISSSEISESLRRSQAAGLITAEKQLMRQALKEFLIHGLRYVFPQSPGALSQGIPTAHSAPVMKNTIISGEPFVWPSAKGNIRGQSIEPLHPRQGEAALRDVKLYDFLALADVFRVGKVREIKIATELLSKMLAA